MGSEYKIRPSCISRLAVASQPIAPMEEFNMRQYLSAVVVCWLISLSLFAPNAHAAKFCPWFEVAGPYLITQGNGAKVRCTLAQYQRSSRFTGTCNFSGTAGDAYGRVHSDRRFLMTVNWANGSVGEYTAHIGTGGDLLQGRTYDKTHPASWSKWEASTALRCRYKWQEGPAR